MAEPVPPAAPKPTLPDAPDPAPLTREETPLQRLLRPRPVPLRPLPLLEARGRPVDDPPPVIEPTDVEPPPRRDARGDTRPLERSIGGRPARRLDRRSFLAPAPARFLRATQTEEREPLVGERLLQRVAPTPAARPPRPAHEGRSDRPPSPPPVSVERSKPPPPIGPRRHGRAISVAAVALLAVLAIGLGEGFATGRLRVAAVGAAIGSWLVPSKPPPPAPATTAPTDPARRAAYYEARAKAGNGEAALLLAILYAKGDGVPQDDATAAAWFRAAADRGVPRAQYDLGVLYEHGRGVVADLPEAVAWYRKAADNEYPLAQYNLAVAYTRGQGVVQDFATAASWYRRAAMQGIVQAMVNLAILYEHGAGVEKSATNAYAWYQAAANRGNAIARQRAAELQADFSPLDNTRAEMIAADIASSITEPASQTLQDPETAANPPSGPAAPSAPVLVPGLGVTPPPGAAGHDTDGP